MPVITCIPYIASCDYCRLLIIFANQPEMGLDAKNLSSQKRGPACVFTQSDQRICYWFLKRTMSKLATSEILLLYLVSVAEQIGLGMTWLETPTTGFVS